MLHKVLGKITSATLTVIEDKSTYKKEAEKNKKKEDEYTDALIKAITLIFAEMKERKSGSIKCPLCDKKLFFRIQNNGHVWGKCETKDCLSWIQ